jgi:SAM-dependent methyltransferase
LPDYGCKNNEAGLRNPTGKPAAKLGNSALTPTASKGKLRPSSAIAPIAAMPDFVVEYGNFGKPPEPDGRLDGPAFHRNHDAIWSAIGDFLSQQTGDVLELGSGTGQHAAAFARQSPHLTWWPSDIYPSHLASIAAWRQDAGIASLRAPQCIDLADPDWTWAGGGNAGGALMAMVCINVLHISPWSVSQNLISGAGRHLRDGGRLFVYGPFLRDGAHTAPSNAAFDASLRAENPHWGVRDVRDLSERAKMVGLTLAEIAPMPANNLVLAFARALRQN